MEPISTRLLSPAVRNKGNIRSFTDSVFSSVKARITADLRFRLGRLSISGRFKKNKIPAGL
jgi:hypothetical protein